MKLLKRLWSDEAGFIVSAELILIATIMVIGLIVGMTVVRNQVVQELEDVGHAIGNVSQGYSFSGTLKADVAQTDASAWDDQIDFCQDPLGGDVLQGDGTDGIDVTDVHLDIATGDNAVLNVASGEAP